MDRFETLREDCAKIGIGTQPKSFENMTSSLPYRLSL